MANMIVLVFMTFSDSSDRRQDSESLDVPGGNSTAAHGFVLNIGTLNNLPSRTEVITCNQHELIARY